MAKVYLHRRNDTKEIFYVGISKLDNRNREKSKSGRNPHWHNIVNKYGYSIEVIHKDITIEEACEIEVYLILFYGRKDLGTGTLVNMTNGGERNLGHIQTEEQKKKHSERMSGKNHPFYGIKRPEHSEKISGENHPMYNTKGGFNNKKHTKETIDKMIGKGNSKKIIDTNTGVVYPSVNYYANLFKSHSRRVISNYLNGKYKTKGLEHIKYFNQI